MDKLDKPYAHEIYQANMDIRFGIKGITSGADSINFGIFKTLADGKTVHIAQVPNANWEIFPKDMFEGMRDSLTEAPGSKDTLLYEMIQEVDIPGEYEDKSKLITTPDFAGLLGEVDSNDNSIVNVVGFKRSNDTAKALNCGARGQFKRDGDVMYTSKTIEIFCPLESMIDFFGPYLLSFVRREKDNEKITDLVDEVEDFVVWYMDLYMPQAMTVST